MMTTGQGSINFLKARWKSRNSEKWEFQKMVIEILHSKSQGILLAGQQLTIK